MTYLLDPRSPLCVPNLSGRLKEHAGDSCFECYGTGHYDGADDYPPKEGRCDHCDYPPEEFPGCCSACDTCPTCDGEGSFWYWCWYMEDRGECDYCHELDVMVAGCDGGSGQRWVCLPCFLTWHREGCGCELWKWAEDWVLGPR